MPAAVVMTRPLDPAVIPPRPDLHYEGALWASGLTRIAGLDEAGRGAWAGPVAAGAVILPPESDIFQKLHHVRDSKQMSPAERTFWAAEIQASCAAWGVGFASSQEIDELGIVPATRLAMTRALAALPELPEYLLIDALRLPELTIPQAALVKGDARSLSIAAASVLAKTARDTYMVQLSDTYPDFGFAQHKGYGTSAHWKALQCCGPCPAHRFSFAPVKAVGFIK